MTSEGRPTTNFLQMDEEELLRSARSKSDVALIQKGIRAEINHKINMMMLDRIQTACYSKCMAGHFEEDLTAEQTKCFDVCSDNFRQAQWIVSECSHAWQTEALAKTDASRGRGPQPSGRLN